MIFEMTAKSGLKSIGKNNLVKNEAILEMLENAAGEHSNKVGYGALDMGEIECGWVLLDWKVEVIRRPVYGEELYIKTWGRKFEKASTYRDYEIYNSNGELLVIATSKWVMMNINKRSIVRLSDEIKECYKPEDDKRVFDIDELEKPFIPENFSSEITYTVGRKDIDVYEHMHNTYYLNLAYEALPEDVYKNRPYDKIRITYKKEVTLGDKVTVKYSCVNEKNYVVISNEEKNVVNAIIELE